jgi:hypothetical protein
MEYQMNVMADVTPSQKGDTLPLCLTPLMESIGRPEWTIEKLEGILGHAFHFEMAEGGQHVNHDNIDWGPALDILPDLARFHTFDAHTNATDVDFPTLKQEAKNAVRASLKKGYAALVWQPMSVEMEAGHHHGFCWGLIVGYNEEDETYTIRHPYVSDTYTIRYDALGHTGAEWFNIQVVDQPDKVDTKSIHVTALKNAIAFAHQTRFAIDDERNAKRRARPHGFVAYKVWLQAFESEEIPLETSCHHTEVLKGRRLAAATYLRDLVAFFPEAAEPLEAAAADYSHELDLLNPLYDLCSAAKERGTWTNENREEARSLIGRALKTDQDAIKKIEAALLLIEESQ